MSRPSSFRVGSLGVAGLLLWSIGCAPVGPDYKRPDLLPPVQHRWAENTQTAATLADTPWWQVFDDDALQALIRDGVAHNLDLRIALARVQESRALAGVAKSFLYPEINLTGGYTRRRATRSRRGRSRARIARSTTRRLGRRSSGRPISSAVCVATTKPPSTATSRPKKAAGPCS